MFGAHVFGYKGGSGLEVVSDRLAAGKVAGTKCSSGCARKPPKCACLCLSVCGGTIGSMLGTTPHTLNSLQTATVCHEFTLQFNR